MMLLGLIFLVSILNLFFFKRGFYFNVGGLVGVFGGLDRLILKCVNFQMGECLLFNIKGFCWGY